MERAYMQKNAAGEVVVDQNGYIKCLSEGGLKFKLLDKEIDFNCDNICCTIDNRDIFIQLNDNVCRTAISTNKSANKIVSNEDTNKTDEIEEVITETAFHWTDNSTKLFLHIYKNHVNLVAQRKIKTKKIMWQKIAEQMKSQGYNVSILQVENKYKSLERAYKNVKNHNNKTGRHRLVCPFET
ncbi:hypothetical protein ALC57_05359 [Trachymyrmex cornetzi]|uniref:Myb/SANT-like DNA-binding domain-containing protein n=1 Tax=Trachymyrmex cornetzi TaxID=471704 RepID=A0A151JB48_9HYME|nr:hypothetical protein ALC57_05359 [Trachymyrmex cornetzi]